jgi:hypothetical protein
LLTLDPCVILLPVERRPIDAGDRIMWCWNEVVGTDRGVLVLAPVRVAAEVVVLPVVVHLDRTTSMECGAEVAGACGSRGTVDGCGSLARVGRRWERIWVYIKCRVLEGDDKSGLSKSASDRLKRHSQKEVVALPLLDLSPLKIVHRAPTICLPIVVFDFITSSA